LKEINEWYDEEGFSANISILENKMGLLKENFIQVDRRKNDENKRTLAIEKFNKELKESYEQAKRILSNKPWVEEDFNKTFLKEISEIEFWFTQNAEKQFKLNSYEVFYFI